MYFSLKQEKKNASEVSDIRLDVNRKKDVNE